MHYNFHEGFEQATVQEAIPSMVSPAVNLAVVTLVETYLGVTVDSDGVSVSFESDAPHHATVQCDLLCPKKAKCSKEALAEISKDVLDEEIKMRMAEYELPDGLSAFAVSTDGTVDYMDLFPSTTTTTNVGLVFGSFSVFYATASLPANWEEKIDACSVWCLVEVFGPPPVQRAWEGKCIEESVRLRVQVQRVRSMLCGSYLSGPWSTAPYPHTACGLT